MFKHDLSRRVSLSFEQLLMICKEPFTEDMTWHALRKPCYHWVTSSISWDLEENVIPESMKYQKAFYV